MSILARELRQANGERHIVQPLLRSHILERLQTWWTSLCAGYTHWPATPMRRTRMCLILPMFHLCGETLTVVHVLLECKGCCDA